MPRKKLCVFITRLIAGGAQKVVCDLLENLDHSEWEITLITGYTDERNPNFLGKIPPDIEHLTVNSVVRQISPFKDIMALIKLWTIFRKHKFDVLHLHTSKAGVLGSIAGHFAGIRRIVYTPHGHIFDKKARIPGVSSLPGWKMKILYVLRLLAYKYTDQLVALSNEDLDEQVALNLAPASKFTVIFNGIDTDSLNHRDEALTFAAAERFNLKPGLIIGSVGRLSTEKGHDVLLRAFALVREKIKNIQLVIIGDGEEYENLRKLADELDVKGQTVFTGNLQDVRPCLWNLTVFVLPSRYESQGLAAMEAMSAGLPVVASEVGGVPGIISSGTDGILVPPGNPQALAEVLLDLCEDASKREKLGKAAASKAASEFRMSKMISSYEELYRGDEN